MAATATAATRLNLFHDSSVGRRQVRIMKELSLNTHVVVSRYRCRSRAGAARPRARRECQLRHTRTLVLWRRVKKTTMAMANEVATRSTDLGDHARCGGGVRIGFPNFAHQFRLFLFNFDTKKHRCRAGATYALPLHMWMTVQRTKEELYNKKICATAEQLVIPVKLFWGLTPSTR